jgi:endonuclease-3
MTPPRESMSSRQQRGVAIAAELRRLYPDADCALQHDSALKLLISTILSAQSTDETVNKVTPALFRRFPDAASLAGADLADIEEIIHATGFFRQKAKSVQGACRKIVEEFGGEVPDTLEALITLPGVARKTANVVLGTWFGRNEGFVVDTHIGRLAHRLGLTWTSKDSKDAVRIEQDLMRVFEAEDWTFLGHALIWHGRRVCPARKPLCAECTLAPHCPSAGKIEAPVAKRGSNGRAVTRGAADKAAVPKKTKATTSKKTRMPVAKKTKTAAKQKTAKSARKKK